MALVDVADWPLVVVNWPDGQLSDGTIEEALRTLTSFYDRQHAVLHDGLTAPNMSPAQRRRLMQHSQAYTEEIRRTVVASAAIVESAWWRGIIRVMQQVSPPVEPFRTFATRQDGVDWLHLALRRAGLWRPPAPRAA